MFFSGCWKSKAKGTEASKIAVQDDKCFNAAGILGSQIGQKVFWRSEDCMRGDPMGTQLHCSLSVTGRTSLSCLARLQGNL